MNAPPTTPAKSWVVSGTLPLTPDEGGARTAHYVITCPDGATPILSLGGSRLTRAESDELLQQVDGAWLTLQIPCRCGRAYFEHDAASPHGADECRAFTAASPLYVEEPRT